MSDLEQRAKNAMIEMLRYYPREHLVSTLDFFEEYNLPLYDAAIFFANETKKDFFIEGNIPQGIQTQYTWIQDKPNYITYTVKTIIKFQGEKR